MVAFVKPHLKTHTRCRSAKDSGRRFYSAEISRWLNRDPSSIGDDSDPNIFAFVVNNPVGKIDFLGLVAECPHGGGCDECLVCGPDITDAFVEHANAFITQPESETTPETGILVGFAFRNGPRFWETIDLGRPTCPVGNMCVGTAGLGGRCISQTAIPHMLGMLYIMENRSVLTAQARGLLHEAHQWVLGGLTLEGFVEGVGDVATDRIVGQIAEHMAHDGASMWRDTDLLTRQEVETIMGGISERDPFWLTPTRIDRSATGAARGGWYGGYHRCSQCSINIVRIRGLELPPINP